jgi:pyruvate ferredoxin oxidoreductase alpha subunit
VKCFRPYPLDAVRAALEGARRVVVLEKALAVGVGGIVGQNVRLALSGLDLPVYDVVAGLGGRPITKASLHDVLAQALRDELGRLTFLDMDWETLASQAV